MPQIHFHKLLYNDYWIIRIKRRIPVCPSLDHHWSCCVLVKQILYPVDRGHYHVLWPDSPLAAVLWDVQLSWDVFQYPAALTGKHWLYWSEVLWVPRQLLFWVCWASLWAVCSVCTWPWVAWHRPCTPPPGVGAGRAGRRAAWSDRAARTVRQSPGWPPQHFLGH